MPLYDFSCEKCGNVFEVQRALGATGAVKCPKCGSTKTAKMFSAAGIVFKGGGFYVTDSKSKSGGGDSKSDKSGKPIEVGTVSDKPAEKSSESEKSTESSIAKPAAEPAAKPSKSSKDSG